MLEGTIVRTLAALLFGLCISLPSGAASSVSATQFDAAIEVAKHQGFEGVIAVSDARRALFSTAIGRANRERTVAHRIDERWSWASVTKQVTAVLVMQEVQRGRMTLDTRLSTLLPSFSGATRDEITVRQLLQHTSGLPNPDDTVANRDGVPAFYTEAGPTTANAARANGFCAGPAKSTPDAKFEYTTAITSSSVRSWSGSPASAMRSWWSIRSRSRWRCGRCVWPPIDAATGRRR